MSTRLKLRGLTPCLPTGRRFLGRVPAGSPQVTAGQAATEIVPLPVAELGLVPTPPEAHVISAKEFARLVESSDEASFALSVISGLVAGVLASSFLSHILQHVYLLPDNSPCITR